MGRCLNALAELRCRIADWQMRREMLRIIFSEEADWEPVRNAPEEEADEENARD